MVAGTDSVETKLKLDFDRDKHDTIAIYFVAMCVNHIVICGAKPMFFIDYLATRAVNVDVVEKICEIPLLGVVGIYVE